MKKLCLFTVFTVFSVMMAQAQNPTDLIQFGVKGGVNFATIAGDGFESPDSRTGFHAGALAELPMTERFSIQPEILYSAQGFKSDIAGEEVEFKMDYIQIPILAKVYLVDGLNLHVGPQIGFRINEKIEGDSGSVEFDTDENDINFGVGAGLGYKFANGFFVQGRYNYGFTEIYPDSESHNSVIQAGVGFMF